MNKCFDFLLFSILLAQISSQISAQSSSCSANFPMTESIQNRFTSEQLDAFCERSQAWMDRSFASQPKPMEQIFTPKQQNWLQEVQSCENLICLCYRIELCRKAVEAIMSGIGAFKNFTNGILNGGRLKNGLNSVVDSGKQIFL